MHYYNEFDKKLCKKIKNLIADGIVPPGDIDDRDIREVKSSDLKGYTQCHFFAGCLGWPIALKYAGWPDDFPVCTGSCPCQPFANSGEKRGFEDERHLLPVFASLVRESEFNVIFGEQVADAIKFGWVDCLQSEFRDEDYSIGIAVLGSHSVQANQVRRRLYWVADRRSQGQQRLEDFGRLLQKSASQELPKFSNHYAEFRSNLAENFSNLRYPHGIQPRASRIAIKAYGNAINPYVGAEFIKSFIESVVDNYESIPDFSLA